MLLVAHEFTITIEQKPSSKVQCSKPLSYRKLGEKQVSCHYEAIF